jgi:tetratricopeptide (TPR) repeat protein
LKRTQRNLFIIMTVMVGIYLILIRLPPQISLGIAGGIIAFALALFLWGRDFFIARHHTKRRQWSEAAKRYELFEKKLLASPWPWLTVPLYLGIYTFDGVAIARNNIAQSLINAEDLDGAERWLRAALLRDPLYPVPYINLGVIAAMRRDKQTAEREMLKALRLGYNPAEAQRLLRRALELGKEIAGRTLE